MVTGLRPCGCMRSLLLGVGVIRLGPGGMGDTRVGDAQPELLPTELVLVLVPIKCSSLRAAAVEQHAGATPQPSVGWWSKCQGERIVPRVALQPRSMGPMRCSSTMVADFVFQGLGGVEQPPQRDIPPHSATIQQ